MYKTKNIIVEIIEGAEHRRTFILREIVPNVAPVTVAVCESGSEIAQLFLHDIAIE